MKKTQTKDTTGKIILSLVFLFLGEGLLGFGLYWPVILALGFASKRMYWYGFIFGVLVSGVTRTTLGLSSLLIVIALFVFDRLREQVRSNMWLVGLVAVILGMVSDRILSLSWTVWEGLAIFAVSMLLSKLDFFNDDLHLSNR